MAAGVMRLGFPPLISRSTTLSYPRSWPESPKSFGRWRRGPRLNAVSASLVKERGNFFTEPEAALIEALLGIQGRGRAASAHQLKDVERAVEALENLKGIPDPTSSNLIEGYWQLMFTTRPGTASLIQRTFVGVDIFKIFQEVYLRTSEPRVTNIVQLSDQIGELKVEAAATVKDGKRILFKFDRAAFSFKFLPFKVPYPVPFRLLGDEAKGWLETTYLSPNGFIRISRGNKGTIFVLQKKTELRQKLLLAVSSGTGVANVIDEVISSGQNKVGADLEAIEGEWQLVWSSQTRDDSWQVAAANGSKGLQIIKKNGNLENHITLFPGFRLLANGSIVEMILMMISLMRTFEWLFGWLFRMLLVLKVLYLCLSKSGANKLKATINNMALLTGSLRFPVEINTINNIELLYIDSKIRITRQNDDIVLIHLRIRDT